MKMLSNLSEKPWGRLDVAHAPADGGDRRIGEVSFRHPHRGDLPVLIKYLYTSEKLSIQVHPDNAQARRSGHPCGKDEMWIVLDAEPGATIGLGLTCDTSIDHVRRAIADGSIEQLVDWRPVKRGDVIYNTAGTIHAAGAGLVLLEVQQSVDLTYRLYDYGRDRELHLERGLEVTRAVRHHDERDCHLRDGESRILADGPYFGAAWCAGMIPAGVPLRADHWQLAVVAGEATVGGEVIKAGECAFTSNLRDIALCPDALAVIAWPVPEALAVAA